MQSYVRSLRATSFPDCFPLIICQCRLPVFVDRLFSGFLTSAALKKTDYLQVFSSWREKGKKVTFVLLSIFATALLMFPLGPTEVRLINETESVFKNIKFDIFF